MTTRPRVFAVYVVGMILALVPATGAAAAPPPDEPYACRQDIHPQDPRFPGVHVAALDQAPDGDLLYVFYAGQEEQADDVATYLSVLPVGSEDWTTPTVVFDEPDRPDGNAVLWTDDENDRVHLFFSTIMESEWTEATLRTMSSSDGGETWTDPHFIREEWGWLFGTLPFRMSNGDVLLPIYSEDEWSVGFYVSEDDGETWTVYPGEDDTAWPSSVGGAIQPSTVELDDGHLLAYVRSRDGAIWSTESTDYGRTWSDAAPTTLPNNNSRVALLQLPNGNLVLAYNPTRFFQRSPLRLALSEDGGQTWAHEVDIESELGEEFSYPYLVEDADGWLHLGYTHRRESMRHLVFNEAFIREGADIPSDPDFDLKHEVTTDGVEEVDTCQFRLASAAGVSPDPGQADPPSQAPPDGEPPSAAQPSDTSGEAALPITGANTGLAIVSVISAVLFIRRRRLP